MINLPPPPIQTDVNDYVWKDWFNNLRNLVTKDNILNRLSWNNTEGTLDLSMGEIGVIQQVGLEQYMPVKNITGSTLLNGTCVGFSGVDSGYVTIQKYIADGTMPSYYCIGVLTQDIQNNEIGLVTTFGYVRDLNTSSWSNGDIMYASPTTAGALTNVKPTVPQITVPVAAVITDDSVDGVLLVRPTLTLGLSYGTFQDTTTQTIAATNTAQAVTLNTTSVSNGVSRGTPTSRMVVTQAGQYEVSFSLQLDTSTSSTKTVYIWLRKNGSDVTSSTRKITIAGNTEIVAPSFVYSVSLQKDDYIEVMWAADSTSVSLSPAAATAFCPSSGSALVTVTQVNQ